MQLFPQGTQWVQYRNFGLLFYINNAHILFSSPGHLRPLPICACDFVVSLPEDESKRCSYVVLPWLSYAHLPRVMSLLLHSSLRQPFRLRPPPVAHPNHIRNGNTSEEPLQQSG